MKIIMKLMPPLTFHIFFASLLLTATLSSCKNNQSDDSSLSIAVISNAGENTGLSAQEIKLSNTADKPLAGLSWSISNNVSISGKTISNSDYFEIYDGENEFENWCSGESCLDTCGNLSDQTLPPHKSCTLYVRALLNDATIGSIHQATLTISSDLTQSKKLSLTNSIAVFAGGWFDRSEKNLGNSSNEGYVYELNPATHSWQTTGSQLTGTVVYALAIDGVGNLFVAGSFRESNDGANTTILKDVAELNPAIQVWQALDDGLNSDVFSLMIDSMGNPIVGGGFDKSGDSQNPTTLEHVAEFNRATHNWQSLSDGLSDTVETLTEDEAGNIFAGGEFTQSGDRKVPDTLKYVAEFNTSSQTWQPLADGLNRDARTLIINSKGNLVAGGSFTESGDSQNPTTLEHVAEYNIGTQTWQPLGDGLNSDVYALIEGKDGNLIVGGAFTKLDDPQNSTLLNHIAEYNISTQTWRSLDSGLNDWVYTLAEDGADNLVAGGFFTASNSDPDTPLNGVAEFNSSTQTWQPLGNGLQLDGVMSVKVDALLDIRSSQ